MKVHCLIIISLIISVVHNSDYEYLSLNKPYTLKTGEKSLKFYQVSLREMKSLPSDIKIETQIYESKNPLSSTIGIYYQPFTKRNMNQIKKEVLGKPLVLDNEFIKSVINEKQNIYIAVYCQQCIYKINMIPSVELGTNKNFIQTPPLRNLIDQEIIFAEQKNNTETRMNLYIANGISGLLVGFFMIFICAIASIIMMKIYVHNTALVEQPLKLGRIEA